MDVNVLVLLLIFSLIPVAFALLGNKAGWALIGFFGVAICIITALVLTSDGDLTQLAGGTKQTLAAANGNFVSDFNAITIVPIGIALTEGYVVIRRAFKI
jgi:uncharacterized membrane protein